MTDTPPSTNGQETGSFEVPFGPLFDELREKGIEPTITQMREFSLVVGFEEEWNWEKLEAVALAFFGADQTSRAAISATIQALKKKHVVQKRPEGPASARKLKPSPQPEEPKTENRFRVLEVLAMLAAVLALALGSGSIAVVTGGGDENQWRRTGGGGGTGVVDSKGGGNRTGNVICVDRGSFTITPPTDAGRLDIDPATLGISEGAPAGAFCNTPWTVAVSVSALLGLIGLVSLAYFLRCPIRPTVGSAHWTQPGGRFFVGAVGPMRGGFLGELGADKLADFFVDRTQFRKSRRVDGTATVAATARNAGVPDLVWQKRQAQRQLLIIEDGSDPLRDILDAGTKLHDMLERRGVQSDMATAFDALDGALHSDGTPLRLADKLADTSTITIVVMDDRILRATSPSLVQSLFTSPSTIWLDPTLTKSAPVSHTFTGGMIRCPITEDALIAALEGLSGLRKLPVVSVNAIRTETDLDPYLQLGDCLPLAMACSQMQPISVNLVDHLRKTFFRSLAPHDVLRLACCSEVQANGSDLTFGRSFQQRLTADYKLRFSEAERRDMAKLLLSEMQTARPSERKSFAHAAWELNFRQIQLAIDPDAAIEGLARLSQTSLRPNLLHRLENSGALSTHGASQIQGFGGPLVVALNQAQIGPLPLSGRTWGILFAITAAVALIPALLIWIG